MVFPAPFGPDHGVNGAARDAQVDGAHRGKTVKILGQVFTLEDRIARHQPPPKPAIVGIIREGVKGGEGARVTPAFLAGTLGQNRRTKSGKGALALNRSEYASIAFLKPVERRI